MVIRFTFDSKLTTAANIILLKKICFSHFIVIICLSTMLTSCLTDHNIDVSGIRLNTDIKRFDSAFFETPNTDFSSDLEVLKKEYPAMFTNGAKGKFWINQRSDKLQNELYTASKKALNPNISTEIRQALKHLKYYELTPLPKSVYTYISRLDFDYPVLYADSLLFVASDLYLGADSKFYQGMPAYLSFEREAVFLLPDALEPLIKAQTTAPSQNPSLLDDMVQRGKIIYALKKVLPHYSVPALLKYLPKEYQFCQENERSIWAYFIEQDLLFNTSQDVKRRFMLPAPFSKFRTHLDKESPGQVGWFTGYQIVNAYAEESGQSLKEILREKDARKILKISNYKP